MITKLRSPLIVSVGICAKCTLNCLYCYAQPFSGAVVSTDRVKELLKMLSQEGVFLIKITGGEPFLHPGIFEILEFVIDEKIPVALLSNGASLPPPEIERLSDILIRGSLIDLQVSLDSVRPEENDAVRGMTERVISTIDALCKRGVRLQIGTVITSRNIHSVKDLIDYFFPRVRNFHFANIMPTPKAVPEYSNLAPAREELEQFWGQEVLNMKQHFGKDIHLTADPHFRSNPIHDGMQETLRAPGCLAAVTSVGIDANLDVIACSSARAFKLGNLCNETFQEIWTSETADRVRAVDVPLCYLYQEVFRRKEESGLSSSQAIEVDELLDCWASSASR